MTTPLSGKEVASKIEEKFSGSVTESGPESVVVKSDHLLDVVGFLKETEGLDFDYLNFVTAVDYYDRFEVTYQLSSLEHNHSLMVKTNCYNRTYRTNYSDNAICSTSIFKRNEVGNKGPLYGIIRINS